MIEEVLGGCVCQGLLKAGVETAQDGKPGKRLERGPAEPLQSRQVRFLGLVEHQLKVVFPLIIPPLVDDAVSGEHISSVLDQEGFQEIVGKYRFSDGVECGFDRA